VGRPRTCWQDDIENLGWNRLGLHPSEMMEVKPDRDVRQLNLELLPPQSSRTRSLLMAYISFLMAYSDKKI